MTAEIVPLKLTSSAALTVIRRIAADTDNIVIVAHGRKRGQQRSISRRQVERCCQMGTITEGPYLNTRGQWQVSLFRHAAGEEITCVAAIDWATKLIVITAF